MSLDYSVSFTGSNETSLGTGWTNQCGTFVIVDSVGRAETVADLNAGGTDGAIALYPGGQKADMQVRISWPTLGALDSSQGHTCPVVRWQTSSPAAGGNFYGSRILATTSYVHALFKVTSGEYAILESKTIAAPSVPCEQKVAVVGNLLNAWVNDTLVASRADNSFSGVGQPGIFLYGALGYNQRGARDFSLYSPTVSLSRGAHGTLPALQYFGASLSATYRERIRYTTVTQTTFGIPTTTPVSRGVDDSWALHVIAGSSLHNGEQIRAGQRVQLFVGDDTVTFSQYASFAKMEVVQRTAASPVQYDLIAQDVQRTSRRYAYLDAAPDVASVTHTQTLEGNPLTLLLNLWTTTSYDTSGGQDLNTLRNSSFDLGTGRGAGIPAGLIDITTIVSLRDTEFPNDVQCFLIREPVEIKPWGEALLKTLNCYPVVTQSGTLSVKRISNSATAVASLTMDNIIGIPQWQAGDTLIANQFTFLYDWGEAGREGEYGTRETFRAEQSVARYGIRTPFVVEAPGVRTESGGAAVALDRATRFFERYADPPPTLQADLLYSQLRIDPGDVVTVTHSWVPNMATGHRGMAGERFEVTDLRPIFTPAEGGAPRVTATLLWIGCPVPQQTVSVTSAAGPQIKYSVA